MAGVVILLFTMTAAVDISIIRCGIVLCVSAGFLTSFNTMISISGVFSSFLFPSDIVTYSSDAGVVLGVIYKVSDVCDIS